MSHRGQMVVKVVQVGCWRWMQGARSLLLKRSWPAYKQRLPSATYPTPPQVDRTGTGLKTMGGLNSTMIGGEVRVPCCRPCCCPRCHSACGHLGRRC